MQRFTSSLYLCKVVPSKQSISLMVIVLVCTTCGHTKVEGMPFKFFSFAFFQDSVSLCSPGCPGTHFVDKTGLELRNLPVSGAQVLGLKACATSARLNFFLK